MTPRTLDAVRQLVRTAAEKRPGEKQVAAFHRAAPLLGVSVATVENIFHGQLDACSEERAGRILAQRRAVLQDRLQFEIEQVERHQAETQRILDEIKQGETECPRSSEIGLRGWLSVALAGSAVSPDGSDADSDDFLFWGVLT